MLGLQVVQFLGAFVEETVELPQLRRLHGLLLPCPSLCNDSCMVQTSENCEVPQLQYFFVIDVPCCAGSSRRPVLDKVVDMPVIVNDWVFNTVEVPQIQFIACLCGHSSCATQTGTTLPAFLVMAAMSGILTLFASFFALLRLSRS